MKPVIQLNNVTRRFGSNLALNNVSLEVPSGCVFALLGENGAGKTTAIRNLLGLDRVSSGSIEVLGMNPQKSGAQVRRQVGYVPDTPALYDWMKVSEAGWFTAGFYSDNFLPNFSRLCEQFELPLDQKIKTLSKGGRAKVVLALAMAHEPELLVMDEPTSGLDTLVRRKFLESMIDVAAAGRTVLLSSHQIPEVERVADHVAIINDGRVLVCDRLDQLKQNIERWVISFDGTELILPSFEGEIISHEGRERKRQQLIVRNPGPDALWQLRDYRGIAQVEVHTPSLEEIFVAFLETADIAGSSAPRSSSENLNDQPHVDQPSGGAKQ